MKIIIHPWAKQLRNGNQNPKNPPLHFWIKLVSLLLQQNHEIIQIGTIGETQLVSDCRFNLSFNELEKLLDKTDTWIGIDSFFQHLAWSKNKRGIVLFSQSDPKIFGHPENINLFVSTDYFRTNQFGTWEEATYNTEAFVSPESVIRALEEI